MPGTQGRDATCILKSHLRALLIAQDDGMPCMELPEYEYVIDDEAGPVEGDLDPEC